MMDRDLLDTLSRALDAPAIAERAEAGDVLVLKAEPDLLQILPADRLIARTTFKPHHDALRARGVRLIDPDAGEIPHAPLTLILPPRQRDEMRAVFARALLAAPEGGIVLAALPNSLGAKTGEDNLRAIAGETQSISKNKCRAFWTVKSGARTETELCKAWIAIDQPQWVAEGTLISRPGLFSWDHVDAGSELLADSVPEHTSGVGADFGAGLGYVSREVLRHCPRVEAMHLYEAEHRALACAQANLQAHANTEIHWADVTRDAPEGRFDFIVMNPPFHAGRADQASLGQSFIRAASNALKSSGTLWMVANRHLPYEAELGACFKGHDMVEDDGAYKIIRAERPKRPK